MLINLEEYTDPEIYDAEYGSYQGDLDFFLSLVNEGSVLDLGCGTGRLTIPFAQRGFNAAGLDASMQMLTRARQKSLQLGIEWVHGDIRNFQLHQQFDLILMAGNTFQALLTQSDQMRMLGCVRRHLKPSGLFVFNTRNPQEHDRQTTHDFEFWHNFQDSRGETVAVFGKQEFDVAQQNVTYTTRRVWKNRDTLTRITLRFTSHFQLIKLIERAGFEICDVYGDTSAGPFQSQSASIVRVCRLKEGY